MTYTIKKIEQIKINKARREQVINTQTNQKQLNVDIEKQEETYLFKVALEMRNFEISQLIQRNNFFMAFQGLFLAGFLQSGHGKPMVSFIACLAGFIVAFLQTGMASGSKFWQEYWEAKLAEFDKKATGNKLFHEEEDIYKETVDGRLNRHSDKTFCCLRRITNFLILRRFSPSKNPIYVGITLSVIWFIALLHTFTTNFDNPSLYSLLHIVGF